MSKFLDTWTNHQNLSGYLPMNMNKFQKNQVALLKNVVCCEDTTDPIDIIRLGELLQLLCMLYYIKYELIYGGI